MFKYSVSVAVMTAMIGVAATLSPPAQAAEDQELAQIRAEIREMKAAYESRIQALEARLQQAATAAPAVAAAPSASSAPSASAAASASFAPSVSSAPFAPARQAATGSNTFNPAVSLILGGTYTNLSQDPARYRIQGFMPGPDIGPGARSFNLGESELTLAANIDPQFSGRLTFSLAADNTVSVEEAFFESLGLSNGLNLKAGRFLSSVGYLNSQHAHTWDFIDAPLAYQAFFGGQLKPDGVQVRWLAPTERFFEVGAEAGRGASFPGTDRNKNGLGSAAIFAHLGDDIGESSSWRAGLSYLHTGARDRTYEDFDTAGAAVANAFSGTSHTWIADAIYKWAPNGNATQRNFKLQGEYFQRKEMGTLTSTTKSGNFSSTQSGWYAQTVYQFMPSWRVGLRHDRLNSGTPSIGLVDDGTLSANDFQRLASFKPRRNTVMVDYSPSEFSRFRLQFARDQARPEATDNQIFIQYIMSLGAHGAHTF